MLVDDCVMLIAGADRAYMRLRCEFNRQHNTTTYVNNIAVATNGIALTSPCPTLRSNPNQTKYINLCADGRVHARMQQLTNNSDDN